MRYAPFGEPTPEDSIMWRSESDPDAARTIFQAVNRSSGLRPTLIHVPWEGKKIRLLQRDGSRRISPFNVVLAPDPPDVMGGPRGAVGLAARRVPPDPAQGV